MKEKKKKERLDVLLVKRGLAESREKAKAIIMTGNVFVEEQREDKAGSTFAEDAQIRIKGTPMKYVSRGGYKLEKAMELWHVPLQDKLCMDVGSSTGGFTDCMLQNGAVKVYAIDVGTNQLAWKLRQDERVVSMEKTNIRYVSLSLLLPLFHLGESRFRKYCKRFRTFFQSQSETYPWKIPETPRKICHQNFMVCITTNPHKESIRFPMRIRYLP